MIALAISDYKASLQAKLDDAKKTQKSPTSLAVGILLSAELVCVKSCINFSGLPFPGAYSLSKAFSNPSVEIRTGQIAFTLIPLFPNSLARDCVRPFIPNFEATYAELLVLPLLPAILDIFIIELPCFKTFDAALHPQKAPFRLVFKMSDKKSSSIFSIGLHSEKPALLI